MSRSYFKKLADRITTATLRHNFLKYKIARCLSGIHDEWAESFFLEIIQTGCKGLQLEALRSLMLLRIEVPRNIQNGFSSEMHKLESFLNKQLTKKQANPEKSEAYFGIRKD